MISPSLRALVTPALVALLATALLALWIRLEPLAMPAGLQIILSIALLAAVTGLLLFIIREERRDAAT